MGVLDILGKRILIFDGGMGSLLQEKGLGAGELPELWNIEKPEIVTDIHRAYFEAGSDVVTTNTFGGSSIKLRGTKYSAEDIINAAVKNARAAADCFKDENKPRFVALDIGPSGKLLEPLGDLSFDAAYETFKEMAVAGERAGCDLIIIETMSDCYELKAAVLAAKENTSLPVFATVVFDENGKLLTGADIPAVAALLEGLGVDALGINCGLGPVQMKEFAKTMLEYASVPVIINPNAGLPKAEGGKTVYDIDSDKFAAEMREIAEMGAWAAGGCCGTTPEHIAKMREAVSSITPVSIEPKSRTIVASYGASCEIGEKPIIIGERINPTGKKRFKQALRDRDIDYILQEAVSQQENGAHILDVNVGLPEINEPELMEAVIKELQGVTELPLQIDTSDAEAMERGLRYYNGKAMINSVNGKKEVMDEVFPLVKKYGGVVVGLTLDEDGIPETAEGRLAVAEKIVKTAAEYGIAKKDIVIDALCMTVSSDGNAARTTLDALRLIKERLGVNTVLGVSNISFGLPQRENITAAFYTMALQNGLSSAIINPNSEAMLKAHYSYCALAGLDESCMDYIGKYSAEAAPASAAHKDDMSLSAAIERGLKDKAAALTFKLLPDKKPLDIIADELIPALDSVGKRFEAGTLFLPQLLMSAEAAKASFEALKGEMDKSGEVREKRGKIILATVKGDIHDIGKNIVKVLLDNYSFDVIDMGKDVPPEAIVARAVAEEVRLVGLSALMTTTVPSMAETIRQLRQAKPDCLVMVGGAVLTQEYADMIGADNYSKDAMGSVHYAQKIFG